jgi:FkbM family methyltransferase
MIVARFFKLLFGFPFLRKHYFGLYKKVFKPLSLFKGQIAISTYDRNLKIKLNIDELIQQQIYFLEFYDPQGINFLKKQLTKGDVFIDIGANIGCYSLIASKLVGENGQVYAFEAIKNIHERLVFNVQLNNLKNVTIENKAVHEKTELLEFFVSRHENLGMSSIFHHDAESGKTEKVNAISLDDYFSINKLNRVNLIKMDIEGAELFALKGMQSIISTYRPVVIMEICDDILQNTSYESIDIINYFNDLNYKQSFINEHGEVIDINVNEKNNYFNFVFIPQ